MKICDKKLFLPENLTETPPVDCGPGKPTSDHVTIWGVPYMVVPLLGWMVYLVMENANLKLMIFSGRPIFSETSVW